MFRGFRWQLLAFVLALAIFTVAALFRFNRESQPAPLPAATPPPLIQPTATQAARHEINPADHELATASSTIYREGIVGSVQRLNPLFAHLNPPDRDISALIFEGLIAFNDYGEAIPRLAAELVISSDGLDYVVRLRDDVIWQDGLPFGMDDLLYTVALMTEPGYAEISPAGAFWQSVEAQKLGENLIRFRLAQPNSSFPALLTFGILPEHALRGASLDQLARHPFNLSPIGTGPYQLVRLETDDGQGVASLRLALSPNFRQRPDAQMGYSLADLRFQFYADSDSLMQAYAQGELEAISGFAPLAGMEPPPDSQIYRQVDSRLGVLIFNWRNPPLEERRVRQALSLALDVPTLAQAHFGSAATYADSPFVPGSAPYLPDEFWTSHDLERAISLMNSADDLNANEDSDASENADTSANGYSLVVEDKSPLPDLARDIASGWQRLGLDFEVEPLDAASLEDRLASGSFDAAIVMQSIGGGADLFRFWHPAQAGVGSNFGAAANNQLAEILETARGEIYGTRRALLYQELQTIFAEQAIAIPLFYPVFTYVARERFEGIRLGYLTSAADRFRGIQDWRPAAIAS